MRKLLVILALGLFVHASPLQADGVPMDQFTIAYLGTSAPPSQIVFNDFDTAQFDAPTNLAKIDPIATIPMTLTFGGFAPPLVDSITLHNNFQGLVSIVNPFGLLLSQPSGLFIELNCTAAMPNCGLPEPQELLDGIFPGAVDSHGNFKVGNYTSTFPIIIGEGPVDGACITEPAKR